MILSRTDLANDENVKDCISDFRRAEGTLGRERPFKLAEWGLKWGYALVENLRKPEVSPHDLENAEAEATQLEADNDHLKSAIQDAIDALDDATQLPASKAADAYEKIAVDLEKSLTQ